MRLLRIDCPTGLAGNMLLAGLVDLGVSERVVEAALADLGLAGRYRLALENRRSHGLRGLHLTVESLEADPPHRTWGSLRGQIEASRLEVRLKERVLAVFGLLAEAEAAVHGQPPEAVHFHEVGALDALVDVVGVCAALQELAVQQIHCGIPPAGHGSVRTAHGTLPLPAPAVLEIARLRGLPLGSAEGFPPGELTTPTGLALVACWADRFGPAPALVPLRLGVGLGSRSLDRPNLVRLCLARPLADPEPGAAAIAGQPAEDPGQAGDGEDLEELVEQQAQIDDATAEDLAFLAEALRQAGALEVFSQPVAMKKGRTGTLVTALLPPERAGRLRQVWWRHSGSLGLRETLQRRWRLPREHDRLATPLGEVRLRWAALPDGRWRAKPEYDDIAALARSHGLGLDQVRQLVAEALAQRGEERRPLPAPDRSLEGSGTP